MWKKLRYVFGLDTETYLDGREARPFLVQVYTEDWGYATQHGTKENGKWVFSKIWEVYRKEEMEEFLRWLSSPSLRSCLFLTYNMSFDLTVLSKLGVTVEILNSGARFIFGKIRRKKTTTYFLDLLNILHGRSLYEVGRKLGVEKLERPVYLGTKEMVREYEKNPQYRDYVRRYAITDAKITYLAGRRILDELGLLRSTIGSTSVHYFSRNYVFLSFPNYPDEVKVKLRQAYRGGRTEVLVRGTIDRPVKYYDFNSLYPAVMYFERFPLIDNSGEGRFRKKQEIDLDNEGVALVTVTVEGHIPLLGIRREVEDGFRKLVFPEGVFTDWFAYPELRTLEEKGLGKVVRVFESFEFRFWWRPFQEFIYDMYRKRKEKVDDKLASTLYKLLMNSLYGKFGEYKGGELVYLRNGEVVKRVKSMDMKHRFYHSVVYAAYITAYGRIWLWRLLNSQNPKYFYYCDTDSVFTSHNLDHLVGQNLGDLKLEGEVKEGEATFIRSKFYIFGDLVRLKGFTLSIKGTQMRELIEKGMREIPQEKYVKPLEALRRKINPLSYEVMVKTFSTNPDYKRIYEDFLDRYYLLRDYTYSEPRLHREEVLYAYHI